MFNVQVLPRERLTGRFALQFRFGVGSSVRIVKIRKHVCAVLMLERDSRKG